VVWGGSVKAWRCEVAEGRNLLGGGSPGLVVVTGEDRESVRRVIFPGLWRGITVHCCGGGLGVGGVGRWGGCVGGDLSVTFVWGVGVFPMGWGGGESNVV